MHRCFKEVKGNIYYNTGNVGIGTNNPTSIFQVGSGGRLRIANNNTEYTNIGSDDTETGARIGLFGTSFPYVGYNGYVQLTAVGTGGIDFISGGNTRMRIASNGNIGIGTSTVNYKLQVEGSTLLNGVTVFQNGTWHSSVSDAYKRFFFDTNSITYISGGNSSTDLVHLRRSSDNISLASLSGSGTFTAVAFSPPSDSRIKKDIEDINDDEALNKLLLIQPTKYNYVDKLRNKGIGKVYGFIAQQIREVIPEAITIRHEIIPNIYKTCLISNKRNVYHSIPLDIAIDTEVQILETEGGNGNRYKIKEIYSDYFVIDKDIDMDEAFVYGTFVDDFHTLNKDYIFTLNVCATQELHRRIEAQNVVIQSHEDRIKDLETKMERMLSNTTQ